MKTSLRLVPKSSLDQLVKAEKAAARRADPLAVARYRLKHLTGVKVSTREPGKSSPEVFTAEQKEKSKRVGKAILGLHIQTLTANKGAL